MHALALRVDAHPPQHAVVAAALHEESTRHLLQEGRRQEGRLPELAPSHEEVAELVSKKAPW